MTRRAGACHCHAMLVLTDSYTLKIVSLTVSYGGSDRGGRAEIFYLETGCLMLVNPEEATNAPLSGN